MSLPLFHLAQSNKTQFLCAFLFGDITCISNFRVHNLVFVCALDHHVLFRTKERFLWPHYGHFLFTPKCACWREKGVGSVSGEDSCPACMALAPEQKIQLSVPSYKQIKEKKRRN